MTVRARLVQVKEVPPGAGVSYGHRYVTSRQSTLGLVPVGYAEGVPRDASGFVQVYAKGRRWFISGTVSMNQFVVDFGPAAAAEGDEVLLSGRATRASQRRRTGPTRWAPSPTRSPPVSAGESPEELSE